MGPSRAAHSLANESDPYIALHSRLCRRHHLTESWAAQLLYLGTTRRPGRD